mgnify:CR=1 FL=1
MIRFVQIWLLLTVTFVYHTKAQDFIADNSAPAKQRTTIYLLPNVYPAVVIDGDTIACMSLHDFIKYSPLRFGSNREQVQYSKLIRDVKKTLPYAKEIAVIITETYEYMETLPDDKSRQRHLNRMEKYLMEAYTPKAFFYNAFASMFGNSLKRRYNPYAEDRLTERVCVLVEQGAF